MIFWILLSLAVLITLGSFIYGWIEDGPLWSVGTGLLAALISGIVGGLIFFAFRFIPWNVDLVSDDTHHLKALGNNSALEGRSYFLGGGYIKDKRVLNFISQRDGGAIRVEQAEAEDATIFEGSPDATVQIKHYDYTNGWVSPWPLGDAYEYTFRIPADSVLESYTLDNK